MYEGIEKSLLKTFWQRTMPRKRQQALARTINILTDPDLFSNKNKENKMKKIRKIVCIAVAFVTVLVCSGVAFATFSQVKTWDSGTCRHFFTTKAKVTKSSGNWDNFQVHCEIINFSASVPYIQLKARPKSSSGYYLSAAFNCGIPEADNEWHGGDVTQYSSYNYIHMQIINPYYESDGSGPNMESNGKFVGVY